MIIIILVIKVMYLINFEDLIECGLMLGIEEEEWFIFLMFLFNLGVGYKE